MGDIADPKDEDDEEAPQVYDTANSREKNGSFGYDDKSEKVL